MKNVFVYCEVTEEKTIADVSLELLSKGRKLAEQLGQICFPNKEPKYLFAVSSTFSLQFGQFINLPFFLILS